MDFLLLYDGLVCLFKLLYGFLLLVFEKNKFLLDLWQVVSRFIDIKGKGCTVKWLHLRKGILFDLMKYFTQNCDNQPGLYFLKMNWVIFLDNWWSLVLVALGSSWGFRLVFGKGLCINFGVSSSIFEGFLDVSC